MTTMRSAEDVGLLEVLGGEQHRDALVAQPADERPHVLAAARIQARGGLVEEHDGRLDHKAACDVDASAHSARVGADAAVGGVGEIELVEQVGGAFGGVRLARPQQPGEQFEVLPAGQQFVDCSVLAGEHDRAPHRGGVGDDVVAGDERATRVGSAQRGEDADRRRLARAVGAEQTEHRPGCHLEVDPAQGNLVAEALLQSLDEDRRGGGHAGWLATVANAGSIWSSAYGSDSGEGRLSATPVTMSSITSPPFCTAGSVE